jgi:branched-chain amino acid transport system substrate-binding protein
MKNHELKTILSFIGLCLLSVSVSVAHGMEPIKLGAVFAKTGKAGASNLLHLKAVRFAVNEINTRGGLLGKQIALHEIDNQSTAIGSKQAAEKAVSLGVCAVIGASWSSHSLAMAPVLQSAKIPMISPVSTNPDVTLVGDFIFRVCFIDPFQGMVMAKFAIQDLSAKSAAVFTNVSNKYSIGLARYFIQQFKKLGGKILCEDDYHEKATDFRPQINKVKPLKPDVIFVPGYQQDSGFIIKQARQLGVDSTFLGGDGWNDEMYKYGQTAIEGSYYSDHWHRQSKTPESRRFLEKYEKIHGHMNNAAVALAYDAVSLLADAIKRSGSTDTDRIRDALAATENFPGVTGAISMGETGDPEKPAVVLRFRNGESVFCKTVQP